MILVRITFQAEFGKADELVQTFIAGAEKMLAAASGESFVVKHARLLTDLSGDFDTVIQELVVDSLADWEKMRAAMFSSDEWQEMQENRPAPPIAGGSTQFFTIEWNSDSMG